MPRSGEGQGYFCQRFRLLRFLRPPSPLKFEETRHEPRWQAARILLPEPHLRRMMVLPLVRTAEARAAFNVLKTLGSW